VTASPLSHPSVGTSRRQPRHAVRPLREIASSSRKTISGYLTRIRVTRCLLQFSGHPSERDSGCRRKRRGVRRKNARTDQRKNGPLRTSLRAAFKGFHECEPNGVRRITRTNGHLKRCGDIRSCRCPCAGAGRAERPVRGSFSRRPRRLLGRSVRGLSRRIDAPPTAPIVRVVVPRQSWDDLPDDVRAAVREHTGHMDAAARGGH
jgi:hypothetical protein